MNNLANVITAPRPASKSVQTNASPVEQINKPLPGTQTGHAADDKAAQKKSFGDVLASQTSAAAQTKNNAPQTKDVLTKSKDAVPGAEDALRQSKEDASPADDAMPQTNDMIQPAKKMIEQNHSPRINTSEKNSIQAETREVALPDEATPDSISADFTMPVQKTSPKSIDEIFAHFKDKTDKACAKTAPQSDTTNIVAPELTAAMLPVSAVISQNIPQAASSVESGDCVSSANDSTNPVEDKFALKQGTPSANVAGQNNAASPTVPKSDATFTNMMDAINTSTSSKHFGNEAKDAAIAASPLLVANAQAAMQAATSPVASQNLQPVQVTINTPVLHDKWGDDFNQKITWLSNQKDQTAELHLNPPQLGPMDVVLKVNGDQATALFTSPHAAVRDAVEQALPRLREMMAESGIMLGNATVSDQAPRSRQEENNKSSGARTAIGGISEIPKTLASGVRISPIARHNGIVDTFA